ncbi:MAG: hypothetical protein QXT37_05110 [Thermofilaceae archaeon]
MKSEDSEIEFEPGDFRRLRILLLVVWIIGLCSIYLIDGVLPTIIFIFLIGPVIILSYFKENNNLEGNKKKETVVILALFFQSSYLLIALPNSIDLLFKYFGKLLS